MELMCRASIFMALDLNKILISHPGHTPVGKRDEFSHIRFRYGDEGKNLFPF
jgi:hypothetical protein